MPDIYQELCNLADSDMYPLHMPGHKRNLESTPLKGAFRCDITEIDGYDNLHDEKGIILEAEKRANSLYGADESFFLVNGSTSGVLSAVSAAVKEGGTILASRGSHRSFYHAAYLRRLRIRYLPARTIGGLGVFDETRAEDVKIALDESKEDIGAVFITSPTYEGKCSDVKKIAQICHDRGVLLIVDAAHGAHFGMGKGVPESAVAQGADIVINSLHKTLPSMTQTGLIHIKGSLADRDLLKRFLRIYQSSSPSYVLMASIDLCIRELTENREDFVKRLLEHRKRLENGTKDCKMVRILSLNEFEDPSKVLIYSASEEMTGQQLYDILREEYALQPEMAGDRHVLAIITGWDTEDGIRRLIEAVCSIDEKLRGTALWDYKQGEELFSLPEEKEPLYKAWDMEKELVELGSAKGRISGEFVNLYPPGIPILVPGEVIDDKILWQIKKYIEEGRNLQGIVTSENGVNEGIIVGRREIICVKQR
jgi:arginine/lysine/ornithine decarboxylase